MNAPDAPESRSARKSAINRATAGSGAPVAWAICVMRDSSDVSAGWLGVSTVRMAAWSTPGDRQPHDRRTISSRGSVMTSAVG